MRECERCLCESQRLQEGWGYLDCRGRGLDFISDLRPSGSSRQLLARAEQSRPACSASVPRGIYGEVTIAAGDRLSPNTLKQSAHMTPPLTPPLPHQHTDEKIRCMQLSWKTEMGEVSKNYVIQMRVLKADRST